MLAVLVVSAQSEGRVCRMRKDLILKGRRRGVADVPRPDSDEMVRESRVQSDSSSYGAALVVVDAHGGSGLEVLGFTAGLGNRCPQSDD